MATPTPPDSKPLGLVRLSATEAQALSALAQKARECVVEVEGASWTVGLQSRPGDEALAVGETDWWVRLHWGGAAFDLVLSQATAQAWIAAKFPELESAWLPDELAAASLEAACAGLLQAAARLQRGPAHLEALQRAQGDGRRLAHHFDLQARGQGQHLLARLATDSLGLVLLSGLVARMPSVANELPAQQVPLCLRAELGFTWLSAQELAGLAVGDTVLVEHVFLTPDGSLWMGAGDVGLEVRQDPQGLIALGPVRRGGWTMTEPNMQPVVQAGEPLEALMDLPLRVTFDVGDRQLTLAQLQQMQVGQVMPLDRPLSSAVSVRVNGALVGTGELVEIDGRLGVTLTRLAVPTALSRPAPEGRGEPRADPQAHPEGLEEDDDMDPEEFDAGGQLR